METATRPTCTGMGKAGLSLDDSLPVKMTKGDTSSDSRSSDIAIPPHLYLKIAKLLREHDQTRELRRSAAIRLFEGRGRESKQSQTALEPIVKQWLDITEWFVTVVHDSGQPDGDHDWEEFNQLFILFEATLTALVGQFFTTIEELDEILEDTNN